MRAEISVEMQTILTNSVRKLFLFRKQILVISDFKTITETITPKRTLFNRHPEPKEVIILTNLTIMGYNPKGGFVGTFSDDWPLEFIEYAAYALDRYRLDWMSIKQQLKAFGFDIVRIEEKETI